jgi:hypothetical protein
VKAAEAAAAAAAEAEAAAAAEEAAAAAEEEKEGFAPLSPDGFAVPEEAATAPQPERAAPSDVEKEQKAAADLAAAAAKVQAAAEARAKAIALADEVKRKEEEEKRAKEEAKRAAEEAEKRAKEEEEAARLRAEEEAMERELAEIAAAQAQALAEIEARQNADQAELEAKAQAKADKNAAAAAERAAAAQAQAEADAAIAAAEADALSVPGSSTASDASAPPAAPSEVPVDLTANATEEDIAARTHRLGANVTSIGCAFGVWAPHAEKMTLLIYGGAPDPLRGYDASAPLPVPARYDMYRDPNNNANWRMEVQQVGAGWRYAFEVTMPGGHTFTRRDPWARETDFDSDVCFVVDPAQFRWSKFDRPKHDELVMYQCHVGTFTGRGDPELGTSPGTFVALTRKLDHIKNLGFNCLQLLPHTEFRRRVGVQPAFDARRARPVRRLAGVCRAGGCGAQTRHRGDGGRRVASRRGERELAVGIRRVVAGWRRWHLLREGGRYRVGPGVRVLEGRGPGVPQRDRRHVAGRVQLRRRAHRQRALHASRFRAPRDEPRA